MHGMYGRKLGRYLDGLKRASCMELLFCVVLPSTFNRDCLGPDYVHVRYGVGRSPLGLTDGNFHVFFIFFCNDNFHVFQKGGTHAQGKKKPRV